LAGVAGRAAGRSTLALTVPKLGAIGHQETEIVGRQIAKDVGMMSAEKADEPWFPEVICIGDMGGGKTFYIHSNSWFGGDIQELRMGHLPLCAEDTLQGDVLPKSWKDPQLGPAHG
jgi:hypothetical protein